MAAEWQAQMWTCYQGLVSHGGTISLRTFNKQPDGSYYRSVVAGRIVIRLPNTYGVRYKPMFVVENGDFFSIVDSILEECVSTAESEVAARQELADQMFSLATIWWIEGKCRIVRCCGLWERGKTPQDVERNVLNAQKPLSGEERALRSIYKRADKTWKRPDPGPTEAMRVKTDKITAKMALSAEMFTHTPRSTLVELYDGSLVEFTDFFYDVRPWHTQQPNHWFREPLSAAPSSTPVAEPISVRLAAIFKELDEITTNSIAWALITSATPLPSEPAPEPEPSQQQTEEEYKKLRVSVALCDLVDDEGKE